MDLRFTTPLLPLLSSVETPSPRPLYVFPQDSPQLSAASPHSKLHKETTRDERIQIQTGLLFKVPYGTVKEILDVTERQILYAKHHRPTPQKIRHNYKLHTPEKTTLKDWLLASPSHRHIPFRRIPHMLPQLDAGEKAIRTAYKGLYPVGYVRRVAKKKGFSDDPRVVRERYEFSDDGRHWQRARAQRVMFSDEVWANGGAHSNAYVTVLEDGSDRLLPECLQHKYSKVPAWMFWGSIVDGKKGPHQFWEKRWGTINSARYDEHIIRNIIHPFFQNHRLEGYIFYQDNAPSHASIETKLCLLRLHIPTIKAPAYSPDLNLCEHVWSWMKNWVEQHYWEARYRVDRIPLNQLKAIILAAWDAVPDLYIQRLYDSWWERCQAIYDAGGGPTRF